MIWTEFELAWYLDTVYYNFLFLSFVLVNYSQTVLNRFRISFASHCTRIHVQVHHSLASFSLHISPSTLWQNGKEPNMSMSFTTVRLRCLIEGEDAFFPVITAGDDDVGQLKKLIQKECAATFEGVNARHLKLWKVNIDISAYLNDGHSLSHLKLENLEHKSIELLQSWKSVSKYWSGQQPDEFIHVIVKGPPAVVRHPPQPIEEELPDLEKRQIKDFHSFCRACEVSPERHKRPPTIIWCEASCLQT